ncbi:hypothetical protein M0811_13037 [Anaeramoeba ignava]|uniref:Uncharacterized protein n=1 Tax=Anaeramoeba ignava TaxID=1746090 RepID=A0A9Q0L6Q2_ANAIG|nr:hypothetical protein M0811_13037 [Anaeramoeba ignava]
MTGDPYKKKTIRISTIIIEVYYMFFFKSKFFAKVKKGSWAVVTGASDGIGKEFAIQLSQKGYNIVLISRTTEKMEEVSKTIKEKEPSRETLIISADLSEKESIEKIASKINDLEIEIFVNNAGQSNEFPLLFHELDEKTRKNIMNINAVNFVELTKLMIEKMMEKKNGLILTMGSLSAIHGAPLLGLYAGTKSFVLNFTNSLAYEYKDSGIKFHCFKPSFIATNMTKMRASFTVPSAQKFVRTALNRIGSPQIDINPVPIHRVIEIFSNFFVHFFMNYVAQIGRKLRRRAIEKQQLLDKSKQD